MTDKKILGMHSNLFPFVLASGFLIGFMAMPMWSKNTSDNSTTKEAQGCGCGCKGGDCDDRKNFKSEMNQDVHAAQDGELARLNPTVVEGAEDIMGAETIVAGPKGIVYMQPWNDLTPQVAGPYYNPISANLGGNTMPTNPNYYDGNYASAHTPTGFSYYDVANDARPQYQFPDFYSAYYNPLDAWRPPQQQIYNNSPVM